MRRNKKKSPNAVGKHGQHTMGAQASASFDQKSPTPHASHAAASFGDGETPGPAQNPYSRRVTQAEYTKKRKSKKRKKIVLAVCIALLVVVHTASTIFLRFLLLRFLVYSACVTRRE